MRVADCHGFAGGFTLGAVQAGFNLVTKCESNRGALNAFGVRHMEVNRHLLGDDWEAQVVDPENWEPADAELIVANPPCSAFSVFTTQAARGANSHINGCMWDYARYVARSQPQVAIMESVPSAFKMGLGLMRALRDLVESETGLEYDLIHVLQNNASLGGCSNRSRYFCVMSRVPFSVERYPLERVATVGDAIMDLESLDGEQWEAQRYRDESTWWSEPLRSASGYVDGMAYPEDQIVNRTLDVMAYAEMVEGEALPHAARRYHERFGQLPESWQFTRRRKQTRFDEDIVGNDFYMGWGPPGRLRRDKPAPVITGMGMLDRIHPTRRRPLTHREIARIMGFPDDWRISPLAEVKGLHSTWGKGVSVQAGRWIAEQARRNLAGEDSRNEEVPLTTVNGSFPKVSEYNEKREYVADVTSDWRRVRSQRGG